MSIPSIIVFNFDDSVLAEGGSLVSSHVVANTNGVMEWSPGKDGGFLIPEVLGSSVLEVVRVHVGNSGCYFGPIN